MFTKVLKGERSVKREHRELHISFTSVPLDLHAGADVSSKCIIGFGQESSRFDSDPDDHQRPVGIGSEPRHYRGRIGEKLDVIP